MEFIKQLIEMSEANAEKATLVAEAAKQQTYAGWKRAVKRSYPDAWFDGDADIANAMIGPKHDPSKTKQGYKGVGEWDGAEGEVFPGVTLPDAE